MGTTPQCQRCGAPLAPDAPEGLCPRCLIALNLAAQTEIPGESGPHGTNVVKPPPSPGEMAKHFPQFEILECLGRGGMGVVYKARQPRLNRLVALKILAPEKGPDARFAERFEREAQALARLNHPNIVSVYDFGEADGLFYLMMEFVDGVSLRQLIQERTIPPEEALAIVPKICEALQVAHEQGVVHRDIKPENVLLDKKGRVKIADFGIAKIVGGAGPPLSPSAGERGADASDEEKLTQGQVLGTPHYMAPEQMEKPQLVDHRADIYSLGVVFYEMLTGELPLGKFQPPSKKVRVDVRLDEVVLRALEKEPELRYQQASQVKSDVETIAATAPSGGSRLADTQTETPKEIPRRLPSAVSFDWVRQIRRAITVGLIIWVLTAVMAALITVTLPKSYKAVTRVAIAGVLDPRGATGVPAFTFYNPYRVQTELEVIQSKVVLQGVAERLDLQNRWARGHGGQLEPLQVISLLKNRMELHPVRNTSLIQIACFSESPREAAEIANAIAEGYAWHRVQQFRLLREQHKNDADQSAVKRAESESRVEILDRAQVPVRPVRPNVPLNIVLGTVIGLALGLLVAGIVLALRFAGWKLEANATPGRRALPGIKSYGKWAFGLFLVGTLGSLLLLTVFPGQEAPAVLFGSVPLVFALILGLKSWQERLGKLAVIASGVVFGTLLVIAVVSMFETAPNKLAQMLANLEQETTTADVADRDLEFPKKIVRLVVSKDGVTFEGQTTNWDGIGNLLKTVNDRRNTLLVCTFDPDQITFQQQVEWLGKCQALAKDFGFEDARFDGAARAVKSKSPTLPRHPVPAPPGLVSWWPGEGTANDVAGQNNGILIHGVTFAPGMVGQAFNFNGSHSYIQIPNSPSLNLSHEFTLELWYKDLGSTEGYYGLVAKRGLDPAPCNFGVHVNSKGPFGLQTYFLDPTLGEFSVLDYPPIPASGVFHHLAVSFRQSDSNQVELKTFIDGQPVKSSVVAGNLANALNNEPVTIGATKGVHGMGDFFRGLIDEVSIYRRVLSDDEVQSIYTAGSEGKRIATTLKPCSPTASGQVSWWRAEGNALDSTGANNGTLAGNITFAPGRVGKAFLFEEEKEPLNVPVSTSIHVPASRCLDVGASNGLSIEAWIKPSTVDLARPIVEWNLVTGGNPYPYGVLFWISVSTNASGGGPGSLFVNLVDTEGGFHLLTSSAGLITTNSFQHVAVTYDKMSGLAALYFNGSVVSQRNLGSFTPQTTYNLYLGSRPRGLADAYTWSGLMDEVCIYSRALEADEIRALFAEGDVNSPAQDLKLRRKPAPDRQLPE